MGDGQASFPPDARLHAPAEFRRVFAAGHKEVTAGLVVIFAAGQAPMARLGLALAKRRIKRAVDRNRVKRVIRESFRQTNPSLPGVDVVVLARSATANMQNHDLAAQLAGVWARIAKRAAALPASEDIAAGQHGSSPERTRQSVSQQTPASHQGNP